MLPTCGQSSYICAAILGVPKAVLGSATLSAGTKPRNGYVGHMWAKWLHHPCHLGDPKRFARGQKSEMATWPTCGQSGYITPAVLGVPNAQREDKNQKWLCCPHVGKVATAPLLYWGSPTLFLGYAPLSAGTKPRNGYVGHMWAKWLVHPYRLGDPQRLTRGQK